jgi:hypothetical protein
MEPSKKGKEGKGGRGSRGLGRTTLVSAQSLGVNLGRVTAVHRFPGCQRRELRVESTYPSRILAPYVRLKRGTEGRTGGSSTPAQALFRKDSLQRGLQQET